MNPKRRLILFLVADAMVFILLAWASIELPDFGHVQSPVGTIITQACVAERRVLNVVTSVVFDYRGVDTVGEEFILFAAVTGITIILREMKSTDEQQPSGQEREATRSKALRWMGGVWIGVLSLFSIYIIIRGHLSPGGGFAGGVLFATVWMTIYLACSEWLLPRFANGLVLEATESLGAGAYVVIGFFGMIAGASYLDNVIPLGIPGSLWSGGTIPLINFAVGVEVTSAFVLLTLEFTQQLRKSE